VLPLVNYVAYAPPWSVTDEDRRQTTTDARKHHYSGPRTLYVGGPVIISEKFINIRSTGGIMMISVRMNRIIG